MPFVRANNEVREGTLVVLAPPGARTANGTGPTVAVGEAHTLRMTLNVSAAAGTTPSLAVTVEHSEDGQTWTPHSSFAPASGAGPQRKVVSGLDRFVRCSWAPTGTTPSFTFDVTGALVP